MFLSRGKQFGFHFKRITSFAILERDCRGAAGDLLRGSCSLYGDGGSHHHPAKGGCSGDIDKWLEPWFTLKVESTGFADSLNIELESSKALGLNDK